MNKKYPKQLYLGNTNPKKIIQRAPLKNRLPKLKPSGGFWTSSLREDRISEWIQWKLDNEYYKPGSVETVWLIEPAVESINLYSITDKSDLMEITQEYRKNSMNTWVIDFEKLSESYDGIWLTKEAKPEVTTYPEPVLSGWDVECTLWFSDNFKNIEKLYTLKWP